jgi:hypothetical protein
MYLHERNSLIFPRMVEEDQVDRKILYSLDWAKQRQVLRSMDTRERRDELVPPDYLPWFYDLQFLVSPSYRIEVRRCVKMATLEWDRPLPYDTGVRETCLETAAAFVHTAFYLLADCAVQPETRATWYKRKDRILVLPCLLIYFWQNQTGRGLTWGKAGLDVLKAHYSEPSQICSPEVAEVVSKFLAAYNEQFDLNEEQYPPFKAVKKAAK